METTLQTCLSPALLEGHQKKGSELVSDCRPDTNIELITANHERRAYKDNYLTELYMQALDYGCVKSLLSNTKILRQILEEVMSLLKMFWRAALPSTDPSIQNLKKVCDA